MIPSMEKDTSVATAALRYVLLTIIAAAVVALFSRILHVNQTTVALVFLVLILATAYRWRLAYSVYVSLLCALLYNFFFLPPLGRLTIAAPQDWIALFTFLFTSVLVSHLSNRVRREAEQSEARRRDVELLYRLSRKLLVQDVVSELARATPSIITSVFAFRAVALYVSVTDTAFYSDPDQILVAAAEFRAMQAGEHEAIESRNGFKVIPLRMGVQHPLGWLVIAGEDTSTEMYEAIGNLVSVALERAAALERSSRLEVARESERLRTALVESVTHDLRTPLTAIRAAATALTGEDISEEQRKDLMTVVDEESARLDRLIGQAVEMARLDSQAVKVDLRPQDVGELVELTLDQMQRVLRDHPVEIQMAGHIPQVRMDRILMQRVLQHLLENAARYSPRGKPITVSARADDGRLVFTVEDHGPGIDPEELPFVFDKYFRGKRQENGVRGTGMGLAISKAILKAHQGGIAAESEAGRGTRFKFWIPIIP